MKDWHIDVTLNYSNGEEVYIDFDVDNSELHELMGAVEYAIKTELPKYTLKEKDIMNYSSLLVTIVPLRETGIEPMYSTFGHKQN